MILRKVQNCKYYDNKKYQAAIIYVQITKNNKIPKNKEIDKLDYIIIANQGNVKHEYKMQLNQISKKEMQKLIYLGNLENIKTPKDEYMEITELNMWAHSIKDIEYLTDKMIKLGTNKNPIYYETDAKNIDDGYIRFLMKSRYYKENLDIIPPKNAMVKDNALLYISLVDSLMVGGFVTKNRVVLKVEDMKEESYKRIEELKNVVIEQKVGQKEKDRRIKILEDLKKRIEDFEGIKLDINDLIENMK